jgi:hypothetical protein
MQWSDWSSDVCSSDLETKPTPKPVKTPKVVKEPKPVKPSKAITPISSEEKTNTGKPSASSVDTPDTAVNIDRPIEKTETEKPLAKPATKPEAKKDIKENKDGK